MATSYLRAVEIARTYHICCIPAVNLPSCQVGTYPAVDRPLFIAWHAQLSNVFISSRVGSQLSTASSA